MSTKLFINLPVANLERSKAFFEKLGFSFNPDFSDDTALCMVISEHNFAMLLSHEKFQSFTPRKIADAHTSSEALVALSLDSREEVDQMVETAFAQGGSVVRDTQDLGFMYGRAFADPDGHIWEPFWFDMPANS
ncbi:VOC family protein [Kiloniella laminariae]|uniref:VOC family protein n=1 Tax=Kiloniella laminariae TaxID=454162 RepID=UPI000363A2E6|nr:VOC family protein [Kiloniella laminariae]